MLATPRYAHAKAGRDRRRERSRGRVRQVPERRLPAREAARRLARPRRRPARVQPRREGAADAAADDRRAAPARRGEGNRERHRARPRERPLRRERGTAVVMDPWNGAIYALASYPTYNQVAAARDPKYLASLYRDPPTPAARQPGDAGRLSDGLDVQADRRRGRAADGSDHAVLPAPLQRLVHARRLHVPQRRGRRLLEHDAHTALAESCDTWFYRSATSSTRTRRGGDPELGEEARARPPDRLRRAR